jgi:hypothetical protein
MPKYEDVDEAYYNEEEDLDEGAPQSHTISE